MTGTPICHHLSNHFIVLQGTIQTLRLVTQKLILSTLNPIKTTKKQWKIRSVSVSNGFQLILRQRNQFCLPNLFKIEIKIKKMKKNEEKLLFWGHFVDFLNTISDALFNNWQNWVDSIIHVSFGQT